jgi:hypothetical protein
MSSSELKVSSITVIPVTATESRIDMTVGDETSMEDAEESVALSVMIVHKACPTLPELQLMAIRRAQEMLASQSRSLASIVNGSGDDAGSS